MTASVAGIDVHKRVLMVVVLTPGQAGAEAGSLPSRRFRTTMAELRHLVAWLQQQGVQEAVMESTAQYWKPVWLVLEQHFRLFLAQAWSNRAPRGKKADFKDAQRLVRRHLAGELTLSFVPDGEQRLARTLTRRRTQLTRDRVRIQNQVESLLEETQVKLSSLVSDLFGASGVRILKAISEGVTDPVKLAQLGDARLQHTPEELAEALTGNVSPWHRQLLKQHLEQVQLVDKQLQELSELTAAALKSHADAIQRLVQVPGIRVVAAQQIVAEAGPQASAFATADRFCSWLGVCPGSQESAGENHSSRCAKGNVYLRRVLCLAAQAAVRTKNSSFQQRFRRLLPRLGYTKAIWATAHRLAIVIWKILHTGVAYKEYGCETTPQARKRRLQRIQRELRALGYSDQLKPLAPQAQPE
ncbi:MAG TPA: IS110 family transposase [Candidatus Saccharimonadales bacterium]|jgi:transposase|nr:IS110 family transposase [Candidatus Saccharimonadales bacterium]HVZ60443.1 IS110 family transposase [Terriglobales bacterium]